MELDNRLNSILSMAARERKGDYHIYTMYKRQIEALNLDYKQYEQAIRKLANVLKV